MRKGDVHIVPVQNCVLHLPDSIVCLLNRRPPTYMGDAPGPSFVSLFLNTPILLAVARFLRIKTGPETPDQAEPPDGAGESGLASWASTTSWAVYARQPTVAVLAADAMLYLTVMSLGLLMTAYLKWSGVSEVSLAIWRGFGAAAGVAATYAFPPVHRSQGAAFLLLITAAPYIPACMHSHKPMPASRVSTRVRKGASLSEQAIIVGH
jgi:hypothetical protein